jgi:hypothetical protein
MIKVDLSSTIPKQAGMYLLGIIPGTLFGLSIALGDPNVAHWMIERAKQVYAFPPYALLILFAAFCMVVGYTFFLLSWFADLFIAFLYRFKRYFIRATFGSNWLYRAFGKLPVTPPKRNAFVRTLSHMIMWGRMQRFPFEIRPVLKCQRLAAAQLLSRRYGITPSKGLGEMVDLEWQAWLSVLGKQPLRFRGAFLTMRTFIGCGLAELAALYFSPALRNRYFLAITVVFVASGAFQSWDLAKWKYEPMRGSLARLAAILVELAETNTVAKQRDNGSDKRANLVINTIKEDN